MNWRKIYIKIIHNAKLEEKNKIRQKGNGNLYERHHILPKSLFLNWSKRVSNLVLLTPREHYFCHQLLIKIYTSPQMGFALWRLTNKGKITSSIDYEIARKVFVQALNKMRDEIELKRKKTNSKKSKKQKKEAIQKRLNTLNSDPIKKSRIN